MEVENLKIQDFVMDFTKYMELIETTVDLDAVDSNEFLIKAEFDDGLKECKDQMDEILAKFPKELSKVFLLTIIIIINHRVTPSNTE